MPECLGKLPPKFDPRTLNFEKYLSTPIPAPPDTRHWETPISDWGQMGNDCYGNCVIASAGHMRLSWRANELGDLTRITDEAVVLLSIQMRATNGYTILDRLNWWRKQGMWKNTLHSYAKVNPDYPTHLKIAIDTFGAADIGLAMPAAWREDQIWDVGHGIKHKPNSWGGHSVPIVGYDPQFCYLVTWGAIQRITWPAIHRYCDEAYALINPDWLEKNKLTPNQFDLAALEADLAEITERP